MNVSFEYELREKRHVHARGRAVFRNPEWLRPSAAARRLLRACKPSGFDPSCIGLDALAIDVTPLRDGAVRHHFVALNITEDPPTDLRTLTEFVRGCDMASRNGWRLHWREWPECNASATSG